MICSLGILYILQLWLCNVLGATNKTSTDISGHDASSHHDVSNRALLHPAYSLFMNSGMTFPGLQLQPVPNAGHFAPGPGLVTSECVRGDIVCPAYCTMEDNWGCKYCPCGPANGMSPPAVLGGHQSHHAQHTEGQHDCMGTILCMLSCKDAYELGPRGNNGCQACRCRRNEEQKTTKRTTLGTRPTPSTPSSTQNTAATKEHTSSSQMNNIVGSNQMSHVSGSMAPGHTNSASCVPFCSGSSAVGGSNSGGHGSGGSGESKGSGMSVPGLDCFGPECSAKNGKQQSSAGQLIGSQTTKINSSISIHGSASSQNRDGCIFTYMCVQTCKGTYILGDVGPDGCNTCRCTSQKLLSQMTNPKTTPKPQHKCPTTEMCVKSCKHQVKLGPVGKDGCPSCACVIPATTTTAPPGQKLCSQAVKCMMFCKHGYQLGHDDTNGCPSCVCLAAKPTKPPVILVPQPAPTCADVKQCIKICRHGYIVESPGNPRACPVCKCLLPPTTTTTPKTTKKPTLGSIMRECPETVHCMKACTHGYILESAPGNLCPKCTCKSVTLVLLCEKPLSCPRGCTVGYKCDTSGCPTCECVRPKETTLHVEVHTTIIETSLVCRARFSCAKACTFGYQSGSNHCPTCDCLEPVPVVPVNVLPPTERPQITVVKPGCIGPSCSAPGMHGHANTVVVRPQNTGQGGTQPGCIGNACNNGRNPAHVGTVVVGPHNIGQGGPHAGASHVGCSGSACKGGGNLDIVPTATSVTHSKIQGSPGMSEIVRMCPKLAACVRNCKAGYNIGHARPGECPPCRCIGQQGNGRPGVSGSNSGPLKTTSTGTQTTCIGPHCDAGGSSVQLTALQQCPETIKCVLGCGRQPYRLHTQGAECPKCTCITNETTPTVTTTTVKPRRTTPSPGTCAQILTCVLTCSGGYEISAVGEDGCPGCHCIDDT